VNEHEQSSGSSSLQYGVAFCCQMLAVSRQGYYKWLQNRDRPYKHALLLAQMQAILDEDPENANYGIVRMHQALKFKHKITQSQSTVARVMRENGLIHKKKRNPLRLTKADKAAQTSDDLLKRDFDAQEPNKKWVSDITQLPTADGKLYISGIFDCFNNETVGLCMDNNMRAQLCVRTLNQAMGLHRAKGVIFHSDRGSQYTSEEFRKSIKAFGVLQSMNSAGGRCHDNAKCESMWARFKEELIYGKIDTAKMPMQAVKALVWRYFFGYWNNRRICSAIGGVPPAHKRKCFYAAQRLLPAA